MQKLKIVNKKKLFGMSGFTLVELIVVIAVLLFVLGTAVSIFISIVKHQRIILSEQEFVNQTSYVLERMSKSLRMAGKDSTGDCLGVSFSGYSYLLTRPDTDTGIYTGIKFINQSDNNICQEFYLDTANSVLMEVRGTNDSVALTSDKFIINSIRFGINGQEGLVGGIEAVPDSNSNQPRITIFLDIQTKENINQPAKQIQTTVSQRDLNVP